MAFGIEKKTFVMTQPIYDYVHLKRTDFEAPEDIDFSPQGLLPNVTSATGDYVKSFPSPYGHDVIDWAYMGHHTGIAINSCYFIIYIYIYFSMLM